MVLGGLLVVGSGLLVGLLWPDASVGVEPALGAGEDPDDIDRPSELVDRDLRLAALALGGAAAGSALSAPSLTLLSAAPLALSSVPFLSLVAAHWSLPGKREVAVLDVVAVWGSILTGHIFAAAVCATFSHGGIKLVQVTKHRAQREFAELFDANDETAWLRVDDGELEVSVESLKVGDVVVVLAGGVVPVDGVVIEGVGQLDERALTGEEQPVDRGPGELVFASTMLLAGQLHVRCERDGDESVAGNILKVLNDTSDFAASVSSRGEQVIEAGAAPTLAAAGVTAITLGVVPAITASYASFGYSMRIAGPLAALSMLSVATRRGVLITDGRALEQLAQVDTFVFDKTGTLTEVHHDLGRVHLFGGLTEDELLSVVAAMERRQIHPFAMAVVRAAEERGLVLPEVEERELRLGGGLKGRVAGEEILVGSARLLLSHDVALPGALDAARASPGSGHGQVLVAVNGVVEGLIELRPRPRASAKRVVRALRERGAGVVMLTGDHPAAARALAEELGIDEVIAEARPHDKAEWIRAHQAKGHKVCFIGDGINDTLGLRAADVSVSLHGASDIAMSSASVVLPEGDLDKLLFTLELAEQLDANYRVGTALSVAPGVITLVGLYTVGLGLSAAILLYNASLIVSVANSLRPRLGEVVAAPSGHTSARRRP